MIDLAAIIVGFVAYAGFFFCVGYLVGKVEK